MSRRLLVNRNVNPAEGVNPSVQPNIGQYGWTSYDAAHINQLISYVDVAREYSERTQLHSDYVRDAMRDFIEPTLREIRVVYTQLVAANNGWTLKYEKFQEDYADFLNKYNVFQRDLGEFKTDLADINVKYVDIRQRHLDISAKHTEVAENTKKVEDIYSEMKDGQVYRGIWNPEGATAYPDPENTNSSWDVVLRDNLDSVIFDNKTWQTGNRLIWIKTDNAYTQIKTTTQVTSVNGKSGAVILTHSDVGAISTSGGTATGAIESPEFKAPLFGQSAQHTMFKSKNAHLKVTDGTTEYSVYSEANKPSAADVGALPTLGNANLNGNMTISGNLTVRGNEIEMANLNVVGELSEKGHRVYSTGNKPTASDIGALATTGGVVYGSIDVENVSAKGALRANFKNSSNPGFVFTGNSTGYSEIAANNTGSTDYIWSKSLRYYHSDNTWRVGADKVYHQGFKPSAADVGAISSTNGSFSGNLTVTNYGKLGSMGPTALGLSANYAAVLSSNDTNGVVLAANSEFNGSWVKRVPGKTASMLIHPTNGITEIRYAPADSDTFAIHKVYSSLNKPTAADVGALPNTGGTTTGTTNFNAPSKQITFQNANNYISMGGDNMYIAALNGSTSRVVLQSNRTPLVRIGTTEETIYHTGNKPTAADVGALSVTGGTVSGDVNLSGVIRFRYNNPSYLGVCITSDGSYAAIGVGPAGSISYEWATGLRYYLSDKSWKIGTHKIYHEGFKPTTLDIQSIDERTKEVSSLADVITEMRLEIESLKSEINQLRSKQ